MIPGLILISFSILRTGEAPWRSGEVYLANAILENVKTYSEMGFPPEQINSIKDNAKQIAATLINILPALVLVNIAFCVWLNLLAAKALFYRQRLYFPDFGDLARWKSPENLSASLSRGCMLTRTVFTTKILIFSLVYFFKLHITFSYKNKSRFSENIFFSVLIFSIFLCCRRRILICAYSEKFNVT
jgi:hypothetical protein